MPHLPLQLPSLLRADGSVGPARREQPGSRAARGVGFGDPALPRRGGSLLPLLSRRRCAGREPVLRRSVRVPDGRHLDTVGGNRVSWSGVAVEGEEKKDKSTFKWMKGLLSEWWSGCVGPCT